MKVQRKANTLYVQLDSGARVTIKNGAEGSTLSMVTDGVLSRAFVRNGVSSMTLGFERLDVTVVAMSEVASEEMVSGRLSMLASPGVDTDKEAPDEGSLVSVKKVDSSRWAVFDQDGWLAVRTSLKQCHKWIDENKLLYGNLD